MYQYTRSFLRPRGLNKTWIAVDVSLVPMATLLAQYVDGYIVVTNPVISATPMYIQSPHKRCVDVAYLLCTLD